MVWQGRALRLRGTEAPRALVLFRRFQGKFVEQARVMMSLSTRPLDKRLFV
jgi:hypothetical protein